MRRQLNDPLIGFSQRLVSTIGVVTALGMLAACGSASDNEPSGTTASNADSAAPEAAQSPSEPGSGPSETPGLVIAGLDETDFGNLTWRFRPGGSVPEVEQIELVDGQSAGGPVVYQLGEVVLAELTGDESIDAVVQITRMDGPAVEDQWYMWIATEEGPVQSSLPVARTASCGTVVHSVTAVESGGVEIHESRRAIGESSLPCVEAGSDERTRVVTAIEARNDGEWWPVQIAPMGGYGGLCPIAGEYDTIMDDSALYGAPDTAADVGQDAGQTRYIFSLEPWPVYGEPFPGWVLIGFSDDNGMGCAWAQTP